MTDRAANKPPSVGIRCGLAVLILIGGTGLLFFLGFRFLSEYHQFRAEDYIQKGYFGVAERHLKRALAYQPLDGRIHQKLGKVCFELASRANTPSRAHTALSRARMHFQQSFRLNSNDAETYYRTGLTAARLESHRDPTETVFSRKNPNLSARFYFQEAVRLRPNGLLYNYALLHDLARHGEGEAILPIVRGLVAGYPPIYADLKQKSFFSPEIESAAIEGLHQAVGNTFFSRQAYLHLSEWAAEKKQWDDAIALYRRVLDTSPDQNTAGHYLHFGKLYLYGGDPSGAAAQFVNSLSLSPLPDKTLEQIYRIYKSEDILKEFGIFFTENRNRFFFSYQADILVARHLIDRLQYDKARDILNSIIFKKPRAEAYYWLARIAQLEKDWDRMELAIHKAILHDPRNPHYHRVFADLLRRMKKTERAEKEAALAEKYR